MFWGKEFSGNLFLSPAPARGDWVTWVGMKPEKLVKIARDVIAMATGATAVIIQAINNSWNIIALLICALLLGVPLVNIKDIAKVALNIGDTNTQKESSPSQPSSLE